MLRMRRRRMNMIMIMRITMKFMIMNHDMVVMNDGDDDEWAG